MPLVDPKIVQCTSSPVGVRVCPEQPSTSPSATGNPCEVRVAAAGSEGRDGAARDGAPPDCVAPVERDWMEATNQRFAYRCLPLNIANAYG